MTEAEKLIKQIVSKRTQILERFAEAYLAHFERPPKISEIEMVEVNRGTEIVWFFRLKTAEVDVKPTA